MASKKPIFFCTLSLDSSGGPGPQKLSSKNITFDTITYTARVLDFGRINQTCPYPSGLIEIGDAVVTLADVDGVIRNWFNEKTPIRRYGQITYGDENSVATPIPMYSGQFVPGSVTVGPGTVTIRLQDNIKSWLNRAIPGLITRDNFNNLPADIQSAFAPIVFGSHNSYDGTDWPKQGRIAAIHVNTDTNGYLVSRHPIIGINQVYIREPGARYFHAVSGTLWTQTTFVVDATDGITYAMWGLEFTNPLKDGTLVNVDLDGYSAHWDLSTMPATLINDSSVSRNPIDHLINLIAYVMTNEVSASDMSVLPTSTFDTSSLISLRAYAATASWLSDYAITGGVNSKSSITASLAISRLCESFLIDMFQNGEGLIAVNIFDPDSLSDSVITATVDNILMDSFKASFPDEKKLYNSWRYWYARQNAGLTTYVQSALEGQWGFEGVLTNVTDQDELSSATGVNPLMEDIVKLYAVSDDDTAYNVMLARVPFTTLRSYQAEFDLPFPEFISAVGGNQLYVSNGIYITHYQGIGKDGGSPGWSNRLAKIVGLKFDIAKETVTVTCVLYTDISGYSIVVHPEVGEHGSHAVIVPNPSTPIVVNGEDDGEYADVTHNFNDLTPAPPAASIISPTDLAGFGFGDSFTGGGGSGGGPGTIAGIGGGFVEVSNLAVIFQRTIAVDGLIQISAFVPNLAAVAAATSGPKIYVGTLSPNTKPTFLGSGDAYRAIFYSTDFDRFYWWTGAAWAGIAFDGGTIVLGASAPAGKYHLCNGASVTVSTISGGTASVTLPDTTTNPGLLELGEVCGSSQSTVTTSDQFPTCLDVPSTNPNVYIMCLNAYYRL